MICTILWNEKGGVEILASHFRANANGTTETASVAVKEQKEYATLRNYIEGLLKDKYVKGK